jgi:hypothetical protein
VFTIRSLLKSFERRVIRPFGRPLRRRIRRMLGDGNRVSRLEARIDELETLVRELTGLAYLRLDEDSENPQDAATPARPPREAA